MGIRRKMAAGAFWRLLEKAGQQVSSLVVFAVIARIIGPSEYGLVALCYVILALADCSIMGVVDPVISMQIRDTRRLSTLFWTVTGIGLAIGLLSLIGAGVIAGLIGEPRLKPLLQVFSVLPLLTALCAVPSALVTASLNFRVYTTRTFVATILGGGVGIYMAWNDYGAFALIGQQITLYMVTNVAVWIGCGWRPALLFSREGLAECLHLGLNQSGSAFVMFFEQQVPRFLLSAVAGPFQVGLLTFVMRLRYALQDCLLSPLISVIHPAFASITHDRGQQQAILDQVLLLFGFVAFPAIALCILLAPQYVPLFFGPAWAESIPLLQMYFISAASVALTIIICDLMRANRQTGHFFRTQAVIAAIRLALVAALVRLGVGALLLGDAAMSFAALLVFMRLLTSKTGLHAAQSFRFLLPSILAAAAMSALLLGLEAAGALPGAGLLRLIASTILGLAAYLAVFCAMERRRLRQLIQFVKNRLRREPEAEQPAEP